MATNQEIAARVIAQTRAEHDSAAACDYYVSLHGLGSVMSGWIKDIAGQVCIVANEDFPEATADECRTRSVALWEQLLPELQAYERRCKERKYRGWSAGNGPIRYATQ